MSVPRNIPLETVQKIVSWIDGYQKIVAEADLAKAEEYAMTTPFSATLEWLWVHALAVHDGSEMLKIRAIDMAIKSASTFFDWVILVEYIGPQMGNMAFEKLFEFEPSDEDVTVLLESTDPYLSSIGQYLEGRRNFLSLKERLENTKCSEPGCTGHLVHTASTDLHTGCAGRMTAYACGTCRRLHFENGNSVSNRSGQKAFLVGGKVILRSSNESRPEVN